MADIVDLSGVQDAPLSARALTRQIDVLAGTGFAAQLNMLVVERQMRIEVFQRDQALSTQVRVLQDAVKRTATTTLSNTIPSLIKAVAVSPSEAATLVGALLKQFRDNPSGPPAGVAKVTLDRVAMYRQDAAHLAEDLTVQADAFKSSYASFSTLIDAEVKALEGPGGEIAKMLEKIESTKAAMSTALTAIVTSGNAMGEAIKNLFVGVVGIFQAGSAAKPQPPTPSPTQGSKPSAPAAGGSGVLPAEPVQPYQLEGIGLVSASVEGVAGAGTDFRASTEALIRQYQELYRLKSILAVATSVGSQVNLAEASLREAATRAQATEAGWSRFHAGLKAILEEAQSGAVPAAQLASRFEAEAGQSWTRLSAQAQTNKAALTGVR